MRPLNRNERLLATALGVALFLIANMVGFKLMNARLQASKVEIVRLNAEAEQARLMLEQRPYWQARQTWVGDHPPDAYDAATSRAKYVQEVTTSLSENKLKTMAQQPQSDEHDPGGRLAMVSIDLTVQGRLEKMVRWLQALQQPGKYEVIRSFTLKKGDDATTMEMQVRLGKVLRAGDLASYP
jgi:hypothetical protein